MPQDPQLDTVHHVAIAVDETWAMLEFANIRLALIAGKAHPPHVGLMKPNAAEFGPLKPHRDGTRSVYIEDPAGNWVEILDEH
jgi:catechol 2,3-dioxygenase-like lactoylglutathione lyase family enzyme